MPANPSIFPKRPEIFFQIPWLNRGKPDTGNICFSQQEAHQLRQCAGFRKIASPGSKVNTSENNFLDTPRLGSQDISQDITSQSAAPLPPRQPGDAVRAEIITTILHLDKAARARVGTGERLARDGFLIKNRWFQIQHLADRRRQVRFADMQRCRSSASLPVKHCWHW